MIVCHCNFISKEEIEGAIVDLLEQDAWQLIVPLQVYHALEKRGRCCGCFPNVIGLIVRTVQAYHMERMTPEAEIVSLVERLQKKHETCVTAQRLARMRRGDAA